MEKKICLKQLSDNTHLWIGKQGIAFQKDLDNALASLSVGDVLSIDMEGIEAFDYSFVNAFFGTTILDLPRRYQNRFFIVENLTEYTRKNLSTALVTLGLAMIERENGKLRLVGKVHPSDSQTFDLIGESPKPVTAIELKDKLGINLTAVNERLSKLAEMGLVKRETSVSQSGRQQYVYSGPK